MGLSSIRQAAEKTLDIISLPRESLVCTEAEFEEMKEKVFLKEVLANAREL